MYIYQPSEQRTPTIVGDSGQPSSGESPPIRRRPLGVSLVATWFFLSSIATTVLFFRLPRYDGWMCLVFFTAVVGIVLSLALWRMSSWARRATLICTGISLVLDWTGVFPSNLSYLLSGTEIEPFGLGFWPTFALDSLLGTAIAFLIIVYMALPRVQRAFGDRW
jgi:hypothetical protein